MLTFVLPSTIAKRCMITWWHFITEHWCQSVELQCEEYQSRKPHHFSFSFARTDRRELVFSSRPRLYKHPFNSLSSVLLYATFVSWYCLSIDGKNSHTNRYVSIFSRVIQRIVGNTPRLRYTYTLYAMWCQSAHNDYAGEYTMKLIDNDDDGDWRRISTFFLRISHIVSLLPDNLLQTPFSVHCTLFLFGRSRRSYT